MMRSFSDYEKELIKRIVDLNKLGHLNTLANIIKHDLPDEYYIAVNSAKDVKIKVNKVFLEQNPSLEQVKNIDDCVTTTLLTIITLFEYLASERLAFLFGDTGLDKLGMYVEGGDYDTFEFIDNDVMNLMFIYTRKKIFVSETLICLVDNDFKSVEQIHSEKSYAVSDKSLGITKTGVYVSIGALVVSILAFGVSVYTFTIQASRTTSVNVVNKEIPISLIHTQEKLLNQVAYDVAGMKALLKEIIKPARTYN